jgi:6-phosphofructokinase 1
MDWDSVGGILQRGGTLIGSAQSPEFRSRDGRRQAAKNLVKQGIEHLVVIGGDGSFLGATMFQREWPELLAELVEADEISQTVANRYPRLRLVGLPATTENDVLGTDIAIGTDTALHRITSAIDRITSTAASHQRTFVVEVMGEHSGYLALMGGQASGADWVLIPESPSTAEDWEQEMCDVLKAGRLLGRRDSMVVVAEGAQDRNGNPISGEDVKRVLTETLGEDTRITVLGHVQRGGSPSAYDRYLATILGSAAVDELLSATVDNEPQLLGIRENQIIRMPLAESVKQSQAVIEAIKSRDYERALELRDEEFNTALRTFRTLAQAVPHPPQGGQRELRLAIMNAGSLAPGMNTAARAATRLAIDRGHTVLGINNGFRGLITGDIEELNWMSVDGWAPAGGSELGTNRQVPAGSDFYAIARNIENFDIHGLLVIGGWTAYETVYELLTRRSGFPAFNLPIICLPATINNNMPGADMSIGADTALNNIMDAVDKIKQSAVATQRCFVVEVMGRYCGYLALMSGMGSGAERVYLHEEGVTLADLQHDLRKLKHDFENGKRLGLIIRNEYANTFYSTEFMVSLFEEEGGNVFDVRQAVLGHLQRGGDPSPLDRILATQLATQCIEYLINEASNGSGACSFIGRHEGQTQILDMQDLPRMADLELQRPKTQWWLTLRPIARLMAQSAVKGS